MALNGYDISQDCILGKGKPSHYGYARVSIHNKLYFAHRLAYEQVFGEIPEGIHIHHKCDNKMCINVNHLEALSPEEHRRIHTHPKLRAILKSKTECINGHPFDGYNGKQRTCSTCAYDNKKRWYNLNKEKARKQQSEYRLRKRRTILWH